MILAHDVALQQMEKEVELEGITLTMDLLSIYMFYMGGTGLGQVLQNRTISVHN